ncbi:MAG: ChaN family lipoprotein [Hyphomicrobiaceae bacterium]|nr:MAG: ChaN family lipoprotein [Hyphomicrobiaceae bacterium]
MRLSRVVLAALPMLLSSAFAQDRLRRIEIVLPDTRAAPKTWISEVDRDHPLVGRMWSTTNRSFFKPESLGPALRRTELILLGEVHDNPDHHRLQAWMIREAAPPRQTRRRPTVVMEMISEDQSAALSKFLAGRRSGRSTLGPEDLGKVLTWEARGWPSLSIYQPIAETAIEAGLTLAHGDAGRERIKSVREKGLSALPQRESERLKLSLPLPQRLDAALLEELGQSHCGVMPATALPAMLAVQRLRDATLADQLLRADARRGAILLAGNGHIRRDRGVPWYLAQRTPERSTLVVMLAEVLPGETDPESYLPRDPDGIAAVDFVWFTPRKERLDPCEAFKRMRSKAPG